MSLQDPWNAALRGSFAAEEPMRAAVRFPMRLPVTLHASSGSIPATTIDVSATGILFATGEGLPVGTELTWQLRLPADSMGSVADIEVLCRGTVVWVNQASPVRLAVQIEGYELKEHAS